MITARTLILGSAAGLIAMSGAQAADLPVKAKAVEYVRICSLYGAGFFYIPGTDTCIKIGGYLRADTTFNGGAHGAPALERRSRPAQPLSRLLRLPLPYGADDRYPHRDRIRRGPDLRSGRLPVQQFRQLQPTRSISASRPAARERARHPWRRLCRGRISSSSSSPASPSVSPRRPTRRRGTASRATSIRACSAATTPTPASTTSSTPPQFGNGVSASIGLDDPTVWNRTSVYNLSIRRAIGANGTGSNAYAGTHAPDIVGNIRVDQAWGLFQLSAAAHEVSGSYNIARRRGARAPTALSEISGHPETKWGGSVMAALQHQEHPDRRRRRHQVRRRPMPRVTPRT